MRQRIYLINTRRDNRRTTTSRKLRRTLPKRRRATQKEELMKNSNMTQGDEAKDMDIGDWIRMVLNNPMQL